MAGVGNKQIIGGELYDQYTPQWYEAMDQDKIRRAKATGTAIGAGTKAGYDAMGNPADTSSSSGSGALGGLGFAAGRGLPPRIGAGGGGGGLPGYETFDTGGGGGSSAAAPRAQIDVAKQSAANAATFGRAKDQVGQTGAGALTGLRSALASRGMLGGQGEYRGTSAVANRGQGELGEVSRSMAEHDADTSNQFALANLGADVTQRGQDLSTGTARRGQNMDYTLGGRGQDITQRGQDITQRGQDIQFAESEAQLKMTKSLQEAADRQKILQGIMGAINGSTLY